MSVLDQHPSDWLYPAILALCLLIVAIFAVLLYRRRRIVDRSRREAALNLWYTREITVCYATASPSAHKRLREVVQAAPEDAILHLLRVQRGGLRKTVIEIADELGKFDHLLADLQQADEHRQISALHRLEVCGTERCIRAVWRLARTTDCSKVRLNAIATLLEMGAPLSVEEAIPLLNQTGPTLTNLHRTVLRRIAMTYAGRLDALLRWMETDYMRPLLALMLGHIASHRAVDALIRLAADACPLTRKDALESLAILAHPSARTIAQARLNDPVEEVSIAALKLLRAIEASSAVPLAKPWVGSPARLAGVAEELASNVIFLKPASGCEAEALVRA